MQQPSKLELTLNDLLMAPLRALRIGHVKLIGYSGLLGWIALYSSLMSYQFLRGAIFELEISSERLELTALRLAAMVSSLLGLPILLTAIAVPVRAIWSFSTLSLLPLISFTPRALYMAFLSLLRCVPQVLYAILPAAACYYIFFTLKERSNLSSAIIASYSIMGIIAAAIAVKKLLTLGLALALSIAAQIDIRVAYPTILRIRNQRFWLLLILLALGLALCAGLFSLSQLPSAQPLSPKVLGIAALLAWYFLVCFTLLALQIGAES